MSKVTCAICGELLIPENDSLEHVIPEAIGGRLRIRGFICKRCNSSAGHTWDAELASQLHPLSLLFEVARQQGSTPSLSITTTAGEELAMKPGGGFTLTKPSFSKEQTPSGFKIQITARTLEEAKGMLAGLKRKFPKLDVNEVLRGAQISTSYPKGLVHHQLEFGGDASGRSIVKSVLALAHHAGVPTGGCQDALAYLRDPAGSPCFGYYYASDLVTNRPAEVPLHCVGIDANPESGLILGYAEYYGLQRVVLCLGRNYSGERLRACHAVDPRSGVQLDLSVQLSFSESDIQEIYDYKMIPDGAVSNAFAEVLPAALKRQFEVERSRVIDQAVAYAFANCGAKPGEMLTKEHIQKLSRLVAEKITPFVLHHRAKRDPP